MIRNRVDVIFRKPIDVSPVSVAEEVNQIWGTARVEGREESLLPTDTNWRCTFEGFNYCRTRMPLEHAVALDNVIKAGYLPQTAEVLETQWDGPKRYFVGMADKLDDDGNAVMIPASLDDEGNPLTFKPDQKPVYVGGIQ